MASERGAPPPAPEHDFDQIERVTARVLRAAAVGVPVWILLLGLLPFTGLGVGACLGAATLVAIAAVVAAERLRARRSGEAAPARPPAARRWARMSAPAAAGLTLLVVAALAYVIFVLAMA